MTDIKTVCVKCRFHNGVSPKATWYDHYCKHPELTKPPYLDPVTGIRHESEPTHCRDHNKGDCAFYEAKP